MTKYVNLFGGPGSGKSTTAARIFAEMKMMGLKVELVTEVAKDFVWEDRSTTLAIQPYITIKQFRNLVRLKGKVDYVITDAPILLGCMYADKYAPTLPLSYKQFIVDLHNQELNPSINFVMQRSFEYDSTGRYQSEDEAKELDRDIVRVLNDNRVRWEVSYPSQIDNILSKIVKE